MKLQARSLAVLATALVIGAVLVWDSPVVPLHPDEATYLFLSADVDLWVTDPLAMAWRPEKAGDPVQRYRTLDAPLGRYIAGLGRALAGLPALPVDWDWGLSWAENQARGALPSADLLAAGRRTVSVLLVVGAVLLLLAARGAASERTAAVSALLLASSALVLLHGRRVMGEGPVIFTTAFTLWVLVKAEKRPWLAAIPAALAFCAKYSLGALAPVGLLAVLWQPGVPRLGRLRQAVFYGLTFAAVVVALNPFLWLHPVAALREAAANRADVAERQSRDRPGSTLHSPVLKLAGLAGSLYLAGPIYAETDNYTAELVPQIAAYESTPLHLLFAPAGAGALLLLLALLGAVAAGRQLVRKAPGWRGLALILAAGAAQALALLVMVPLPFQRYYLPLVPYSCFFAAFALDRLLAALARALRTKRSPRAYNQGS